LIFYRDHPLLIAAGADDRLSSWAGGRFGVAQ